MREPQDILRRRRNHPFQVSEDEKLLLEKTAATLLRLWFSILWTLQEKGDYDNLGKFRQYFLEDLTKITLGDFPTELPHKIRVNAYVTNLSSEGLDQIVSKPIDGHWYRDAIHLRIAACETAKEKEKEQDYVNAQFDYDMEGPEYEIQEKERQELGELLEFSETLCTHIEKAATSGFLQKHITFLKEKLQKMHKDAEQGYEYLGREQKPLAFPDDADQDEIPNSPPNSAQVTSIERPKTQSALAFIVPVICILSAIPACLALYYADNKPGGAKDSDFFQLLASVPIQLLGIFTAIWPIIKKLRPDRAVWIQCWTYAILSFCLTIGAVPLYLLASSSWSAISLFAGSFMQSFLQLQLILEIPRQKVHED